MGSILVGVELPEYGNDTMFACTRAAYDALSDGLKAMLKGMKAVHGAGRAFSPTEGGRQAILPTFGLNMIWLLMFVGVQTRYAADSKEAMKYVRHPILDQEVEHPVVRTNPDSGRKGLYVNSMFTYRSVSQQGFGRVQLSGFATRGVFADLLAGPTRKASHFLSTCTIISSVRSSLAASAGSQAQVRSFSWLNLLPSPL
jgi:Taurine catabolism dioxygenase TauD, TfdA family